MLLFISDLHLSEQQRAITEHFLDFLNEHARHADALYILGDLFDCWVGDDHKDTYNDVIIKALAALKQSRTTLYFQRGNHDFLIGERFAKETHCVILKETHVLSMDNTRTLLMHGDSLCWGDADYQEFRKMVYTPRWQAEFLAHPPQERYGLAIKYRNIINQFAQNKPMEIMDVSPEAVTEVMGRFQVDLLIHGHTHRPAEHIHQLQEQSVKRIVLGDWRVGEAVQYLQHDKQWSVRQF